MPQTDWGWQVTPDEIRSWILYESDDLLAIDKPAHLVCHPSKKGPWSSLIGACREYVGVQRLHMVSRLDRETSGVVVFAKTASAGRMLQTAIQDRSATKTYLAILTGNLEQQQTVDQPIGSDPCSEFVARRWINSDGQTAVTEFVPLAQAEGYTLAEIHPITGRRHQIRIHAAFLGHPIVGDKLYGPDPSIMLRFITEGFTPDMQATLKLHRHALHAHRIEFPTALPGQVFAAPWPAELHQFWTHRSLQSRFRSGSS